MTTSIQVSAPAPVVLQCTYNACFKSLRFKQTAEHFILPSTLTAFASSAGLYILMVTKPIDANHSELIIYCDNAMTEKTGEGKNIQNTSILIKQLAEDLQQQGYIR